MSETTHTHDDEEYIEINGLYADYWPDHWDEKDVEAFADIIQQECHVRLVKQYDQDEVVWSVRVPKAMTYFSEEPYYE